MTQETQHKLPLVKALWAFVIRTWRGIVIGLLVGAVVGFSFPTFLQVGGKLGQSAIRFTSRQFGAVAVWPKRGTATLVVVLSLVVLFYGIRLGVFLKRVWISWGAGLVSGTGVMWFVTSAVAFTLLNLTGSSLSFFVLAVGVATTLAVFYRDVRIGESVETLSEADPDDPISKDDEDILGRGSVVASIVRAIVNDRAPVVALTGNYGDGKTSVLNLLSKALEGRKDVVCVRFSTWLPTDQKTLVSSLLSTVLAELETVLFIPKIKRNLVAITRLLFAVLPKVPAPLVDLVEKPSQDQQIGELQRNLSRLPIRVVVLLDDLDRMRRKELDVLFKLLRGVPEFPQFTYVCAFDRNSIVQILRRNDSEKSREETEHFLEKFFPDETPLPKIEESCLAVEFEKRFYTICDRNNLIMDPDERQKFKDQLRPLWQMYLKGYFSNLRRVKLFTNRLKRSLPIVALEVNLRDFVLLEIVRMMHPVLYELIFRNARYFMFARWRFTAWLEIVHPDEEEEQKRRNSYFDVLFKDLPKPPEGIVLAVLEEVFPMVKSYLNGGSIALGISQGSEEAQRERRVYHPDFFPRYFIFNVPADLFGEKELSAFVTAMNEKTEVAQCVAIFKDKYAELQELPMKRWDFLRRVNSSIARFDAKATRALAVAISELSGKLEEAEAAGSFDEITGMRIVFGAANQLRASVGAQAVLESVIKDAISDRFATQVLNESSSNRNRLLENGSLVHKDKLEQAFRERMKAQYGPGGKSSFFPENTRMDITPLGRWALCGLEGREQVHDYLKREFRSAHWKVGRFLSEFFPPPPDAPPGIDPMTAMKVYFPPNEVRELLDEYGDSSASSPEETQAIKEFRDRYEGGLS